MTVADVMTPNVECIHPDVGVDDARRVMRRKGIHHLAVTANGELLGVVSSHDLSRPNQDRSRSSRARVRDVMTRHVLTVSADASVTRAAYVMRGRSVGCLIVRRGRRLEGIVTTSDLLSQMGTWRRVRASTKTAIHHRTKHTHRPTGDGRW